ncbi:L,D-transpeptidase family protein [Arabiibacter massiliensis]|uniref:L,D-transpeptidase family protein n=1 Tax=Arabiibacter massiliensis TaxID=1870985 RepID=UPI0009B93C45|nr:L,D-transpeptidase family protein [Arabiibacter massiliensis]
MSKKSNPASHGRHAASPTPSSNVDETTGTGLRPVPAPQGPQGFAPAGPPTPADFGFDEKPRNRRPLKVAGIVLGILVALALAAYLAGAFYFTGRFMPNTTVGDHDVSLMTGQEVGGLLAADLEGYAVSVSGQGFSMDISAKDAGMAIDTEGVVGRMLDDANPWLWPIELTRERDETDKMAASYNEGGLGDAVRAAVEEFNASAELPVNATVAFDEGANAFAVQKESVGTALDPEAVIASVDEALATLEPTVKLTAEHLLQPSVLSTDGYLKASADAANQLMRANMQLMMGGTVAAEVNPALLSTWVKFDDALIPSLDEEALAAWVDETAAAFNTVGTERSYTRPDGKAITVAGGPYGWSVDRDALLELVKTGVAEGTTGEVEVPCETTGTAYNGAGAQDWGARYCDIDLSEQYVRFYDESGSLVWESACVSGTPNGSHNTPPGVYWLNQKASPSKLKGTNLDGSKYESTVQYWMPFVGNVIGMHDADWQPYFGGTRYLDGGGSHGCVNLPPGAASVLYGIIQSGDVVVCHW